MRIDALPQVAQPHHSMFLPRQDEDLDRIWSKFAGAAAHLLGDGDGGERGRAMKRIIFCFDGTWNKIDGEYPTNVTRIAQSVSRYDSEGSPQVIYYDEGVGTTATDRLTGGILGHGLKEKIIEAYHFLVLNYEPGDELHVFGFSRGAFTARSFVGLIRNSGIISRRSLTHIRAAVDLYVSRNARASPNSERARQFRFKHCPKLCLPGDLEWRKSAYPTEPHKGLTELRVQYLGVWDTVGALGIPNHLKLLASLLNRQYQFHDTTLSSFVLRARHAIAADEKRRTFEPSLWTNLDDLNEASPHDHKYEQQIFPGVHSAVGGGGPVRGLSDGALEWIFEGAREQGLEFDTDNQSPIFSLKPNALAELFNATGKAGWSLRDRLMGIGLRDRAFPEMDRRAIHESLARRYRADPTQLPERRAYRPPALKSFWIALDSMASLHVAGVQSDISELASAGDDRVLRSPRRVRKYVVRPGDTLALIAEREMGSVADERVLALHNRNVGLLFEDNKLYAGSSLEIPEYDAPKEVAPEPPK